MQSQSFYKHKYPHVNCWGLSQPRREWTTMLSSVWLAHKRAAKKVINVIDGNVAIDVTYAQCESSGW